MPSIQWDHPRLTSQLFGYPVTWLAITLVIVLISYVWMNQNTHHNTIKSAGLPSPEDHLDSQTQTASILKQRTMAITKDSDGPRAKEFLVAESQEKRMDPLFESAEKNYNLGNYIYPENQNAWNDYQKILAMDPQNNRGKSGLLKIKNLLIDNVQKTIETGDFESAEYWLVQLDTIQPEHPFQAGTRNEIKMHIERQAKLLKAQP